MSGDDAVKRHTLATDLAVGNERVGPVPDGFLVHAVKLRLDSLAARQANTSNLKHARGDASIHQTQKEGCLFTFSRLKTDFSMEREGRLLRGRLEREFGLPERNVPALCLISPRHDEAFRSALICSGMIQIASCTPVHLTVAQHSWSRHAKLT